MKMTSLAILLALTSSLMAQEEKHNVLTLEQCRQLALQHNKELAASAFALRSAHYTRRSMKAAFLPSFNVSGTALYSTAEGELNIPGGNLPLFQPDASGLSLPTGGFAYFPGLALAYEVGAVYTAGLSVEQPVYMGGRIRAGYRLARIGETVASLNGRKTTADVIEQTDQSYLQLLRAKEMERVAQRYHALLEELHRNVEKAHARGMKSRGDLLKVQVKLNESELSLLRAGNARRLAGMNLCHYIGRPLREGVEIGEWDEEAYADSTLFPVSMEDASRYPADISSRPEYALLEQQTAAALQRVKLARGELLPQVGVRGGYNYLYGMELNDERLFDKGSFSIMLNVSFPLYHFGERVNKVRAAKAQWQQTRMEQENLTELMQLELQRAADNLEEARMECRIADRSLEQAAENLRASTLQYEAGMESLTDHLEAQAQWQQALATRVDSRTSLHLACLQWLKATGRLDGGIR